MTRRVRLDFEGVFAPATRAPDADDVAQALVKAARATGELAYLSEHPTGVLTGALGLRARFMALAALRQVWPRCAPFLANRWTAPRKPAHALAIMRKSGWWSEAVVSQIAFDLCDAHRG